ncbi:DMT family transporter [Stagnihabitans tardus]|uniref:EamA family transporter n=1 Tax=Stagnihabitans tardus TaxID=2699202 RepID=A0AAE5BSB1_9RHOB|nr:DMT family transporter [Stagnihabitans tardus]NBZ87620.1 EamA family transporter [Stagnihabitans tardus]
MTRNRNGLLLLLAGSAVDSSSGLLTRLTTADGFTTASARGFLAFGFLFAVLALVTRGRPFAALRAIGPWGLGFAVMNSAGMVLNVLSLKFTSPANFFMIFATAPFIAALLAWGFLKERPDRPTLIAALAGLLGIAIMVSGGLKGVNLGDVLALVVVLGYCANVLILRRAPQIEVLPLITATVLGSGLLALPFASFGALSAPDWAVLTTLGFLQLGLGNILIFSAVSRVTAAEAGLLGLMGAVFAPLWVLAGLGELPPTPTLIGGAVILVAGVTHFFATLGRTPPKSQE